ncbi:hypothetical protein [Halobacillus ihumii]|uniref:hypothetical protein n=1 Tax=Halobacillus ihumii TaxID=2686092 RepID=UPI0013D81CB0|nr:hypothetical protein [Halobacillus ihumii]
MKSILIIMTVLTLFLITGCTTEVYKSSIEDGNNAIQKADYEEALNQYENAQSENNTDEARNVIKLLQLMNEGANAFEDGNMELSISNYGEVLDMKQNGLDIWVRLKVTLKNLRNMQN